MIYTKLTRGWVAQQYDSETGDCVRQEFLAEQEVRRLYEDGQDVADSEAEELENTEKPCAFDMVQP
jgi:hypothetical protein